MKEEKKGGRDEFGKKTEIAVVFEVYVYNLEFCNFISS